MELFEYQTGLKTEMLHRNKNRKDSKVTEEEIVKLKRLMPMDWYIYEYAKQLFDRRWQLYLNMEKGTSSLSEASLKFVPNLPKVIHGCKSTPKTLQCPDR